MIGLGIYENLFNATTFIFLGLTVFTQSSIEKSRFLGVVGSPGQTKGERKKIFP
jgi:hypothetical protein